ncbi:hypothetical protein CWR48_18205 [Oceanobacillus arenosus]|uniref:Uncharacterized protein n=1 Tax=Oceanobacillus arenosus TaxID=1229153 RepID=A0A3D8PLK8_9BACI|nr:hypothetical protein [Oceanobacillus arenosus]RDW16119.1 hypothetical protein CWR48_18205 [Oceanobacillus arenosus]
MTLMISIGAAYKHLGGKEKYPTRLSRKPLNERIRKLVENGIVKGVREENKVNIQSLKKHLEFESNILENYMGYNEFLKTFGINTTTNSNVFKVSLEKKQVSSDFEYVSVDYPINREFLFIRKSTLNNFLKEHISFDEAVDIISQLENDSWRWYKHRKLNIQSLQVGAKRFYTRSDFEKLKKDVESAGGTIVPNYYTTKQYREVLSITTTKASLAIEKDYQLNPKKLNGHWKYYDKELVDRLRLSQSELKKIFMSYEEAKEIANAEGFVFGENYIEKEPIDSLLRPFYKSKKTCYLKENFYKWLGERRKKEDFYSVTMDSHFDTFKLRLEVRQIKIDELGRFTNETWLQFISRRLANTTANSQSIESTINRYVYCSEYLINLVNPTNKKEIYSVTSNDINILFNSIPKTDSRILYQYFKKVYYKLIANKMTAFDFNKVNDPLTFEVKSNDKSIYEYEVYKKVYNYAKDISLHKKKAIKDIFKEITTGGEKNRTVNYYASSWLYVLLHLNNAWRNSDFISFPRINLNGTKITNLHWLLENELGDEDVDYIVRQVYRTEFIISKTQVKNYFFCSEELKKSLATAIAICELRNNAIYPMRKTIIDFGNKKQNFSDARRRKFFESFNDNEFIFSSRKMNRSLMSYIYVILSKIQKGTAGLKTIQKMRGHLEEETTNFYVDIPENELNFLTRQLFSRGSFGFVYDTFLDVLQGVEIDREKRTNEILCLGKYFGGIHKVEVISSFLNVIQNDRKTVLDRILSMGLNEALEFVNKIETSQLPSKEENVQCMFAESGCVKKGQGISCFDCAFSIPNYYALSALGASLQDRLNNYLESQKTESEILYNEQRKRARLFYMQLEMFAQAIQRFGFEVYEFIEDSREEFIAKQDQISSLQEEYQLQLSKGVR